VRGLGIAEGVHGAASPPMAVLTCTATALAPGLANPCLHYITFALAQHLSRRSESL
jgi:hypothetical protein